MRRLGVVATAIGLAACGGGDHVTTSFESKPLTVDGEDTLPPPLERWLTAHQSPSGVWEAAGFRRWRSGEMVAERDALDGAGRAENDVLVTSLALIGFLRAGHRPTDDGPIGAATHWGLRWLESMQCPDGAFARMGERGWAFRHAIATWAATEAAACDAQRAGPWARRAMDCAVASYLRADPGWDDDTGPARVPAAAWLALAVRTGNPGAGEGPAPVPDVARRRIYDDVARWSEASTDLARNAAAILARAFRGDDPKSDPDVLAAAERCVARLPRWDPADATMDVGAWYLATAALHRVGGSAWARWSDSLRAAVVATQRTDTTSCRYKGSWDPVDRWGPEGGRVYATVMGSLILALHYDYERVFEEGGTGASPPLVTAPADHSAGRVFLPCESSDYVGVLPVSSSR